MKHIILQGWLWYSTNWHCEDRTDSCVLNLNAIELFLYLKVRQCLMACIWRCLALKINFGSSQKVNLKWRNIKSRFMNQEKYQYTTTELDVFKWLDTSYKDNVENQQLAMSELEEFQWHKIENQWRYKENHICGVYSNKYEIFHVILLQSDGHTLPQVWYILDL